MVRDTSPSAVALGVKSALDSVKHFMTDKAHAVLAKTLEHAAHGHFRSFQRYELEGETWAAVICISPREAASEVDDKTGLLRLQARVSVQMMSQLLRPERIVKDIAALNAITAAAQQIDLFVEEVWSSYEVPM